MVLVEAKVMDATHLELARPISLNRGRKVLVVVTDSPEPDAEHEQWLERSATSLSAAYGEQEPDYAAVLPDIERQGISKSQWAIAPERKVGTGGRPE